MSNYQGYKDSTSSNYGRSEYGSGSKNNAPITSYVGNNVSAYGTSSILNNGGAYDIGSSRMSTINATHNTQIDKTMTRSTYGNFEPSGNSGKENRLRLEEALTRICILALENDRLNSYNKRLKSRVKDLEADIEEYELFRKNHGDDSNIKSRNELLEKENLALKELLEKRNVELDSWRKKFLEADTQLKRYMRIEGDYFKLKDEYNSLETQFDDVIGERDSLIQEIELMKENDRVTAIETMKKVQELETKIQLLAQENDRLHKELANREELLVDVSDKLDKRTGECNTLGDQ